jgi:hypothetical protein
MVRMTVGVAWLTVRGLATAVEIFWLVLGNAARTRRDKLAAKHAYVRTLLSALAAVSRALRAGGLAAARPLLALLARFEPVLAPVRTRLNNRRTRRLLAAAAAKAAAPKPAARVAGRPGARHAASSGGKGAEPPFKPLTAEMLLGEILRTALDTSAD